MKTISLLLMLLTLGSTSGCIADPLANRELVIRQNLNIDNSSPQFDLDTHQIPDGWIEEKKVEDTRYGDRVTIKLAPARAVKVVLLPVGQN